MTGVVSYSSHKCEAKECVCSPQRQLDTGTILYFIRHADIQIIHLFHDICFLVELSRSTDFLRGKRITACPCCKREGVDSGKFPNPQEVAKTVFVFFQQHKNYDGVRQILRSGLIPKEMKKTAASQDPIIAEIVAEKNSAVSIKLRGVSRLESLQFLANEFVTLHPACTLAELRKHLSSAGGQEVSLGVARKIHPIVKDMGVLRLEQLQSLARGVIALHPTCTPVELRQYLSSASGQEVSLANTMKIHRNILNVTQKLGFGLHGI